MKSNRQSDGLGIVMMNLHSTDGTETISVHPHKLALVRTVLDMGADDLAALQHLVALGPDRVRALQELAESWIAAEQEMADHPRRLPVVQNGRLVHPIACLTRVDARRRDEPEPSCTWAKDGCGYTCEVCKRWEGEEMPRGQFIASRFAAGDADGCARK